MRRKIIVADDEAYVTTILASKLRQGGHEVTTAHNGQQALELATQNPPDLIITDYQMPLLSGYDLSVKLRQDPRTANVPLIMLTARGHHLSAEQLAATNIQHLSPKPFSARELLTKVDEILAAACAGPEVQPDMTHEPATIRAKASYEALAARCAELGFALWHCTADGRVLVEPQAVAPELRAQVEPAVAKLCTSDRPELLELSPGRYLVPLEDREGSRRVAMNLALVDAPDAQTATRFGSILTWCMQQAIHTERDSATIDQFSEKLAQAYEETNVLYRMARVLNNVGEPSQAIAQVANQLQQVLPFGWLAIRISDKSQGVRDLAGRMLVAGQTPCDQQIIRQLSDALLDTDKPSERAMLLHPQRDELARAVGAEVLAEHITHDNKVIGLLLAGNKGGPDPELSSFETQFLDATADFLGVFHENLSRFAEQQETFLGTLRALTAAIDAKDRYTRGHSERVGLMASKMAAALGLDRLMIDQYKIAGIVHDVGKIGVPEAVLTKPGRLTDEEFAQIKLHPGIGHHILQGIPRLTQVLPGVLWHHERWDGRGYPDKLAGDQIPMIARVLALADTFDAMSSNRSYRPALPRQKVLEEIVKCAGAQFDPALAPMFVNLDFTEFDDALEEHKVLEQRAA